MNIMIYFLIFLSFILIWQFLGYPMLMTLVALKTKQKIKDYSFQPFITILVPTYNEEKVIKKRIENLRDLNYPKDKYEILIVDSGSTDKTMSILIDEQRKNESSNPILKVVKENERRGKASAINFGKKFATGNIILVTDANAIFDKNVLYELMPHFKDPKIGAVGGRYCVSNIDNVLAKRASFYWDLEYVLRIGEAAIDSACLFHGEINAWRKDLVDADPDIISEDLDMCIKIRQKNYKIEYDPDAIVFEPSPIYINDQIRQRKRTCIGTIKNLFVHRKYFLFTRNLYTSLIFPSHKLLTVFSPFIFILIFMSYVSIWNCAIIGIHLLIMAFISIILFASMTYLWSNFQITKNELNLSIYSIFDIILYTLLNEFIVLLAWKDFLLNNYSVLWEKAKSTR